MTETKKQNPGITRDQKRLGTVATLWTKRAFIICKRENHEPYPVFFFFFSFMQNGLHQSCFRLLHGETICVTPTICIFSPYFQPITESLSVMSSIINNLAFILTHICKAQLSTVCTWKGKAVTSCFICRTNWEHNMQQFFIPWSTLLISGE